MHVPVVIADLPVGARLHQFGKHGQPYGQVPRSKESSENATLPLPDPTNLARSRAVSHLTKECGRTKEFSRTGQNSQISKRRQRIFLGTGTQQVETCLDLSTLNTFKKREIRMDTAETIRTSLQTGEWVMSIHFKDAYFHIPIQAQSRKYLHFHIQSHSYQLEALPFGLFTASIEFTVATKADKLLSLHIVIIIHQY